MYKERVEFANLCDRKLQLPLGAIACHVCANIDKYHFANEEERANLADVCGQMFCDGPSKNPVICARIRQASNDKNGDVKMGDEPMRVMSRALMVAICAAFAVTIGLALLRAAKVRTGRILSSARPSTAMA